MALYSPAIPDSGASNGIVTYSRIMRDALRKLGHQVFVVTTEHLESPNGEVTTLPKIGRVIAASKLGLRSLLGHDRGQSWVSIHVQNAFEAVRQAGVEIFEIEESYGWGGELTNRGVAIVERLHGPHVFVRNAVESPAEKRLGDRREASERASFATVQAVTSPTRGLLDALVQRYQLKLGLTSVIPNPMPVAPVQEMWLPERANLNQLLFVGRFDSCKGADVVLRAFVTALVAKPELTLVMAGPDTGLPRANGGVLHFTDFVMSEVPPEARERITFLGTQPPRRVSELRLESGAAIIGSRYETFPYSIAEALAVGMPIIATATFGATEMIRDGIDGRIVPVADVDKMAKAMIEIVSAPARFTEFGRSAYVRASELLSPERVATETVALYRQAISRLR